MDSVVEFTESLVKGLVKNPDIVKVKAFKDEDGIVMVEIIVHNEDMGSVIGRSGNMAKSIRTLVNAAAYKQGLNKIRVNIDSI